MRKLIILTMVVFFTLTSLCFAQNFVPGEVLVKWKKSGSFFSIQNTMWALGLSTKKRFPSLGIQQMKLRPGMKVETALTNLKQNPDIEYAEPNYIMRVLATPDDPQFAELWGLHNTGQTGGTSDADIDAPEAWDIHKGSHNVVIAVIDSGVAWAHPDLDDGSTSNIWTNIAELNGVPEFDDDKNGYTDDIHGWDFVGDDRYPTDYHTHGTHVAGTIAAIGDNGVGITGVNWYASIMPLRISGPVGLTDTAKSVEAIVYAVDNGAKVINASWGGGGFSQALYEAISHANDQGVLFVAAAGNGGDDGIGDDNDATPFYPASYDLPNIISVAATDYNDNLAAFSNYGATSVDVAAPGVSILSSVPVIGKDTEVNLFNEDFDFGRGNWTSWGTNDTWEISTAYSMSPPNSLADSPSGDYLIETESYITYNTPLNLVDKSAWMELELRCELEDWYDYMAVGGDLGGGNGFLPTYVIGYLDGLFTGSTVEDFCFCPLTNGFCCYSVDISPLGDLSTAVNIGFMLYSDSSITEDGVYIDNVAVYTQDLIINGYDYDGSFSGTSMAAPHVAGVAGLILARYPRITLQELKERILNTVDSISSLQGKVLTGGRINAYKALDPTYGPDLAVDFAAGGIWDYDGSAWSRLASSNPEHLAVYDNKLVGDFGSGGIWEYDGTSWTKLTSSDADNTCNSMVAYGTSLAVDFGGGGIWEYDGSAWSRLTSSDPEGLAVYGSRLVGDFGVGGMWEFDGASWTRLSTGDADNTGSCMVAYGASLAVDFGGGGIWEYDGSSWSKLSSSDPEDLAVYGSRLVGDFGSGGIWEYDGTSWTKLSPSDADNSGNCMVAYGTSLVIDFGGGGIWDYDGSSWSRLTSSDAEDLGVYSSRLVGDFGIGGLWEFDGTSWTKLTQSDADNNGNYMVAVDLE